MARGKRSKNSGYISNGERSSVNKSIRKALRLEYLQTEARLLNQQAAWRAGKAVMLTVPNPDKKNTKERTIRVPATSRWGYPRSSAIKMR
jgi:hypothetical protein